MRVSINYLAGALALILIGAPSAAVANALTCPAVFGLNVLDARGRLLRSGTAFAIDARQLATAAHVIDGAAEILVFAPDFKRWRVQRIVASDPQNDVAIVRVRGALPTRLTPPPTWQATPAADDALAVLAFAPGQGFVWLNGQQKRDGLGWLFGDALEITAPLLAGMSGGPVVDSNCRVLGIAAFAIEGRQHAYFARPVAALNRLLAATHAQQGTL